MTSTKAYLRVRQPPRTLIAAPCLNPQTYGLQRLQQGHARPRNSPMERPKTPASGISSVLRLMSESAVDPHPDLYRSGAYDHGRRSKAQ